MKRHARTLPLFITMVAMLAFAAPGYGVAGNAGRQQHDRRRPGSGVQLDARGGADHYVFELDSGSMTVRGTPLVSISTKNTEATLTTTVPDGPYTWQRARR